MADRGGYHADRRYRAPTPAPRGRRPTGTTFEDGGQERLPPIPPPTPTPPPPIPMRNPRRLESSDQLYQQGVAAGPSRPLPSAPRERTHAQQPTWEQRLNGELVAVNPNRRPPLPPARYAPSTPRLVQQMNGELAQEVPVLSRDEHRLRAQCMLEGIEFAETPLHNRRRHRDQQIYSPPGPSRGFAIPASYNPYQSQPPQETPAFNPYAGHADLEEYTNSPGNSSPRKHLSASRQASIASEGSNYPEENVEPVATPNKGKGKQAEMSTPTMNTPTMNTPAKGTEVIQEGNPIRLRKMGNGIFKVAKVSAQGKQVEESAKKLLEDLDGATITSFLLKTDLFDQVIELENLIRALKDDANQPITDLTNLFGGSSHERIKTSFEEMSKSLVAIQYPLINIARDHGDRSKVRNLRKEMYPHLIRIQLELTMLVKRMETWIKFPYVGKLENLTSKILPADLQSSYYTLEGQMVPYGTQNNAISGVQRCVEAWETPKSKK